MKEDITALLYFCILFKLVVQFLSLYSSVEMYGVNIIVALLVLGQFHASVTGENEAIALFLLVLILEYFKLILHFFILFLPFCCYFFIFKRVMSFVFPLPSN